MTTKLSVGDMIKFDNASVWVTRDAEDLRFHDIDPLVDFVLVLAMGDVDRHFITVMTRLGVGYLNVFHGRLVERLDASSDLLRRSS